MDFEKKYKEALERAKAGKPMDEVFPELKESEDERIRKGLIDIFSSALGQDFLQRKAGLDKHKVIAYLEKRKEKPSPSIYWHAIKEGDTLPCRAYLWTTNYEKYHDCFEGRLIPNVENVTAGADMWYLPVDDVYNLPREGVDELPKELKPALRLVGDGLISDPNSHFELEGEQKPTELSEEERIRKSLIRHFENKTKPYWNKLAVKDVISWLEGHKKPFIIHDTGCSKRGTKMPEYCLNVKPAEWSEEDEKYLNLAINIVASDFGEDSPTVSWLKSLRPQPHWKPSEEQMNSLMRTITWLVEKGNHTDSSILADLRHELQNLM